MTKRINDTLGHEYITAIGISPVVMIGEGGAKVSRMEVMDRSPRWSNTGDTASPVEKRPSRGFLFCRKIKEGRTPPLCVHLDRSGGGDLPTRNAGGLLASTGEPSVSSGHRRR